VPAGEFDALKIERRVYIGYWESPTRGNSVIQEYEWYAPSVKWRSSARPMASYLSYSGENKPDSGFVRVGDGDQSGGPRFLAGRLADLRAGELFGTLIRVIPRWGV